MGDDEHCINKILYYFVSLRYVLPCFGSRILLKIRNSTIKNNLSSYYENNLEIWLKY